MIVALLFLVQQEARDFRAHYEISGQWGQETLSASMVLNRSVRGEIVLVGRQSLAGNLFYLWLNDRAIVLYLPRERTAYQGHRKARFSLFHGGPTLSGDQWLALFRGETEQDLHPFLLTKSDGDIRLTGPEFLLVLHSKAAGPTTLKPSIFVPVVPGGTKLLPWEDYAPR
jgi:hypothetical protein